MLHDLDAAWLDLGATVAADDVGHVVVAGGRD